MLFLLIQQDECRRHVDGRPLVQTQSRDPGQDNEPLMRALAKLVAINNPDLVQLSFLSTLFLYEQTPWWISKALRFVHFYCFYPMSDVAEVLFVGEALVGNDAIDQAQGALVSGS